MPKVDHSKCEHEHDGARYNSCGSCGKPLWVPALGEGIGGFSRGVDYKTPIVFEKSQDHSTVEYKPEETRVEKISLMSQKGDIYYQCLSCEHIFYFTPGCNYCGCCGRKIIWE